jgi:RNA polymerase sigma factor (sigma-70 family)
MSLNRRIGEVTEQSLEEVTQAYLRGDAAAFDQLYRRVSPLLYSYLLRLTRDRSRAEDLLQITFVKFHRARASYIAGESLVPWLLAIARRTFLDECRRKRRRSEDLSPDGRLPERHEFEETFADERSDAMAQALAGLPENYRAAIQLTKIAGLSLSEAACVLDSTPTAIKLRVHRGYNLIRHRIEALQVARA